MIKSMFLNIKLPIYSITFSVMIDSLCFGLVMPMMPDLLLDLGCKSISDAAFYGGILSAAFALMQFIFNPLIGNLSDRFGRRPILLASLVAMFFYYLIMSFANSIWILLVVRIICGIVLANYSTASAIIADVSHPKDRLANYGLLGTALGFGFILGALVGGLLSSLDLRTPFYAATIFAMANLIFGFLFIKETFNHKKRRRFKWAKANPLMATKSATAAIGLKQFMLVIFFYEIAFLVYQATWAYFTKERFAWDANTIGISLGFFGLMTALIQGLCIRFFLSRLGEYKTAAFALLINIIVFLIYPFVSESWMIFALIPLSALGSIFLPAVQSIVTSLVKDDYYGELQSGVTSIRALSLTIGLPLMTGVFSFFPGAAFFFAMIVSLISFIIFLRVSTEKSYKKVNQELF